MREGRTAASRTALALALTPVAAGCNASSGDAPASSAPSIPAASPSSAVPTATASRSPSATPSPSARRSPSATTTNRTAAELRKALLGLKDVPAGFEVESAAGGENDGGKASSSRTECSALVRLLNATKVPGSRADAQVSFSGGQDGPFVDESLDALGTAQAARSFVADSRAAVKNCRSLSLTIDGVGTSTLQVREISFASAGDSRFAARFSATKRALEGFELIQAGAQSGDVLVGMTFVGLDPAEVEQATQDAVAKVEDKLGTSGSI